MVDKDKNVIEFLTVTAEYCAFIEKADEYFRKDFLLKLHKLLPLLYLKGALLPEVSIDDSFIEKYVSEDDWNYIHDKVLEKLSELETYFDITEAVGYETGETVNLSISEAVADIYQDLRDFLAVFKDANDELMEIAVFECKQNFKLFWGARVIGVLQELHLLIYSGINLNESENNDPLLSFGLN